MEKSASQQKPMTNPNGHEIFPSELVLEFLGYLRREALVRTRRELELSTEQRSSSLPPPVSAISALRASSTVSRKWCVLTRQVLFHRLILAPEWSASIAPTIATSQFPHCASFASFRNALKQNWNLAAYVHELEICLEPNGGIPQTRWSETQMQSEKISELFTIFDYLQDPMGLAIRTQRSMPMNLVSGLLDRIIEPSERLMRLELEESLNPYTDQAYLFEDVIFFHLKRCKQLKILKLALRGGNEDSQEKRLGAEFSGEEKETLLSFPHLQILSLKVLRMCSPLLKMIIHACRPTLRTLSLSLGARFHPPTFSPSIFADDIWGPELKELEVEYLGADFGTDQSKCEIDVKRSPKVEKLTLRGDLFTSELFRKLPSTVIYLELSPGRSLTRQDIVNVLSATADDTEKNLSRPSDRWLEGLQELRLALTADRCHGSWLGDLEGVRNCRKKQGLTVSMNWYYRITSFDPFDDYGDDD